MNPAAPSNVKTYTGAELDPDGFYDVSGKEQDPSSGRYLSAAPVVAVPSAATDSGYAYASDDPAHVDHLLMPDPEQCPPDCGGGGGGGGGPPPPPPGPPPPPPPGPPPSPPPPPGDDGTWSVKPFQTVRRAASGFYNARIKLRLTILTELKSQVDENVVHEGADGQGRADYRGVAMSFGVNGGIEDPRITHQLTAVFDTLYHGNPGLDVRTWPEIANSAVLHYPNHRAVIGERSLAFDGHLYNRRELYRHRALTGLVYADPRIISWTERVGLQREVRPPGDQTPESVVQVPGYPWADSYDPGDYTSGLSETCGEACDVFEHQWHTDPHRP